MKIEWRAAARESLLEIVDYIADDDPGAALALLDEIEEKVGKIPENPFMHRPGRVPGTRELVVRANYLVVYTCTEENVLITQVLHASQLWP